MRFLAISDEVSDALYRANITDVTGTVDVLLGCGDLPYDYMEFVVTQTRVRDAFYVHGNHDGPLMLPMGQVIKTPGGWRNVDQTAVYVSERDVIIGGLEGSIRYASTGSFQYTQREMRRRARRLVLQLLLMKVLHGRYLDILITHAPPAGIHDTAQGAHRGFEVLLGLMRRYRPRLLLHGHNHTIGPHAWQATYGGTEVINVQPFFRFDYADGHLVADSLIHG